MPTLKLLLISVVILSVITILILIIKFKIDTYNYHRSDTNRNNKPDKDYREKNKEQEEILAMESHIVDVNRPIGYWTHKIIGEKIGLLKMLRNILNSKDGNLGYWKSLIKAEQKLQERHKNRGRSRGEK